MTKYKFKLVFTEEILGSSPADPEIYKSFIASRAADDAAKHGKPAPDTTDEVETLDATSEKLERAGWSVFHKDDKGLFFMEYHVKGFLKEAATCVVGKKISAIKSKIDRWVFVAPRRLHFQRNGGFVKDADGFKERPLRAMTMQGPRVSLKRSDYVKPGIVISGSITVLPLGEQEIRYHVNSKGKEVPVTCEEVLRQCFDYGQFHGIGEWANGGFGRFSYELEKVSEDAPEETVARTAKKATKKRFDEGLQSGGSR